MRVFVASLLLLCCSIAAAAAQSNFRDADECVPMDPNRLWCTWFNVATPKTVPTEDEVKDVINRWCDLDKDLLTVSIQSAFHGLAYYVYVYVAEKSTARTMIDKVIPHLKPGCGTDSLCGTVTLNAISYSFNEDNQTLSIFGFGDGQMISPPNFSGQPWCSLRNKIKHVVIGEGITHVGYHAFEGLDIESVSLPDSLTSIGTNAFSGCSKLTSIVLPKNLEWVEVSSFENCIGLKSVTIPPSVTEVRSRAFYGCPNLESVTIEAQASIISNHAFANCNNLKSVTLRDGISDIGKYTFCNCTSLESFTLPSNLSSMNTSAFEGCSSLTHLSYSGPKTEFRCGDNVFLGCNIQAICVPPDSSLVSVCGIDKVDKSCSSPSNPSTSGCGHRESSLMKVMMAVLIALFSLRFMA